MTTLLKLANKIEAQLRKEAAGHILQQLNALVSAAYATFQFKPEVKKLVAPDSDIYEGSSVEQGNLGKVAQLHKIMESIYFGASAMKTAALETGLSQADMASRRNRIIALCDQASAILTGAGVASETFERLGFNVVRAAAEDLSPVQLPALAPKKPAPVAPAEETGVGYTDQDPTRFYRDDPTPDQLQDAIRSLQPKPDFKIPVLDSDEFGM